MVKYGLVFFGVVFASSGAIACGILEKATPRVGSTTASAALHNITLNLSQPIKPGSASIHITDTDGHTVAVGKTVDSKGDTALSANLPALAPGKYKVEWSVVWLDCDTETQNHYSFTVAP